MDNVIILDAISNSTKETINTVNNVSLNVADNIDNINNNVSNVINNQQKVWLVQPSDTTIYSTTVKCNRNDLSAMTHEFYLSFPGNYRITGINPIFDADNASLASYTTNGTWKSIKNIKLGTNTAVYLKAGWHKIEGASTASSSYHGITVEIKGTLTLDNISNYPLVF